MIDNNEIEFELIKKENGKRVVRIVHLTTGIAVQDDEFYNEPLVERRKRLLKKLENILLSKQQNY